MHEHTIDFGVHIRDIEQCLSILTVEDQILEIFLLVVDAENTGGHLGILLGSRQRFNGKYYTWSPHCHFVLVFVFALPLLLQDEQGEGDLVLENGPVADQSMCAIEVAHVLLVHPELVAFLALGQHHSQALAVELSDQDRVRRPGHYQDPRFQLHIAELCLLILGVHHNR